MLEIPDIVEELITTGDIKMHHEEFIKNGVIKIYDAQTTLTVKTDDIEISLTYHGNENVFIKAISTETIENENVTISIPRHILEKFLELINN